MIRTFPYGFPCSVAKLPGEAFDICVNFANRAHGAITLNSITSTLIANNTDSTSAIISVSPAPTVSGPVVTFRIQGGENGQTHLIYVSITDGQGDILEQRVTLTVVSGTGH
jgi:hypothetical protein